MWDCHWLLNFTSVALCIEIASNDNKPSFSSEDDAAPHHPTASAKKRYSIGATLTKVLSTSSPHFDAMTQMPEVEPGLTAEHNVSPHVQDNQMPDCQNLEAPEAQSKSQS